MNIIRNFKKNVVNIPGKKNSRRLVVFESDDWGSIRMPSKTTFNKLLDQGIRVDKCPYNSLDTLASSEDLIRLSAAAQKQGRYPR